MKKNRNRKPADVHRLRLERFAVAASNMKFACEFAMACMDLRKQTNDPEMIEGFNKSINEVSSALEHEFKEGSTDRRYMNELDVLGAIYFDQLDPKYTVLARVPSFKIPGLLS